MRVLRGGSGPLAVYTARSGYTGVRESVGADVDTGVDTEGPTDYPPDLRPPFSVVGRRSGLVPCYCQCKGTSPSLHFGVRTPGGPHRSPTGTLPGSTTVPPSTTTVPSNLVCARHVCRRRSTGESFWVYPSDTYWSTVLWGRPLGLVPVPPRPRHPRAVPEAPPPPSRRV